MIDNKNSVIVIGGLHTDIIASGASKLLGSGEYTHGKELKIGPGGKSFLQNDDVIKAAKVAILAGTLQFHKSGIQPVTKKELKKFAEFANS